jgi:hypothetical protein
MEERQILTGVGYLYLADVGTSFPEVNAEPGASWTSLGETQDGVTVTLTETLEQIRVDQKTGAVKVVRTEESVQIETNLALVTMANMEQMLGNSITETEPDTGVIGEEEIQLHRGFTVAEYALLFRGTFSPEDDDDGGPYPAQFQVPRAHLSGDLALAFQKGSNVQIPFTAEALEDLDAATAADAFGKLVVQTAAAT